LKGVVSVENDLFNKSEETLMNFLWTQGKPISNSPMSEHWEGKEITDHHLWGLTKSLKKKSAIKCYGVKPRERQYSRISRYTISKEGYCSRALDVNDVSHPKSLQVESVTLAEVGRRSDSVFSGCRRRAES